MTNNNQHIIVGTAGHVDHGKTELTATLTGINTDRLPEEKKRGMTIVPGFVPLELGDGLRLGLIDVPGHEKFVKNMLAGVAGIDMVLLVIAADEGVMPQTVEHLHILHLLGIDRGIAVITKSDLADEEWLEMIREQVSALLLGTSLENAPILACSAYTGAGIQEVKAALKEQAAQIKPRSASGHARLPIDRVFSKTGFGTVITGTLWSGSLHEGQAVQLWPCGKEARIRSLQVHGQPVESAFAGQRTAVNLSGIEAQDAPRGGWLAEPALLRETHRIDVELRLLSTAKPLAQRSRVRIHHGTAEALGRVRLLDREMLQNGETCFAQLELENPLPPLNGDKIILRSYSPMVTIAGCSALDINPPRHKQNDETVLAALAARTKGDPAQLLEQVMVQAHKPLDLAETAHAAQIPTTEALPLLETLTAEGRLLELIIDQEKYWLAEESSGERCARLLAAVEEQHKKYPLRMGLPLAEIKKRFFEDMSQKQLLALLNCWQQRQIFSLQAGFVSRFAWQPHLSQKQAAAVENIRCQYNDALFMPPEWQEAANTAGIRPENSAELLTYLLEQGILIHGGEYFFSAEAPAVLVAKMREDGRKDGFPAGDIRQLIGSNRKYTLALLEYTDSKKMTVRAGDLRFPQ